MNRIRACGGSLVFAALLVSTPVQAVAAGACGADIDLVGAGATIDLKPMPAIADGSMLAAASGPGARSEGTERRDPPGPVAQEAQWIRSADTPVAEPGILVLLIAGFLGVWAVARRRNYSS